MSMFCTSCGHNNPDQLAFCQACGKPLQRAPESISSLSQHDISQTSPFPLNNPTSPPNEGAQLFMPQMPPSPFPLSSPASPPNEGAQLFMPQTPQALQAPIIPIRPQEQLSPPIVQMGTISTGVRLSKVHAFAGHGVLVTHHSWFLSDKARAASDLLKTSFDIFQRRSILGLNIQPRNLEDYGTETEIRHYLILQRGIATVFLYIAPAGHDLYISRVTTALTSIDPFRRFLLIALIVLGVLLFIIFPISIPIWLILITFFGFSFRNWLQERDFWIYLRKRELNDFQLDDLSLIESVTDDTIFAAAKQNKIDSDKLVPPKAGYEHKRRIRAV